MTEQGPLCNADQCTRPAQQPYPRLLLEPVVPRIVELTPIAVVVPLCAEHSGRLGCGIAHADLWP